MTAFAIEKLARRHPVETFDCGQAALNRFLLRFALPSQHANASQTYVGLADAEIVGFYTLVVSEVAYADAPERLTKGLARHPVPLMLLARLAVGVRWQGRGIGAGLLKDAMRRTVQAAEIVGIRALAAHAKDDAARAFYEHFGFASSPTDPLHVFLLTKDLQRVVSRDNDRSSITPTSDRPWRIFSGKKAGWKQPPPPPSSGCWRGRLPNG